MKNKKTNSDGFIWAYSAPAFALSIPTIPAFIYLPTLYAETLGLAIVGFTLLAARIFDVISDPLIGALSDNFNTRWGQRKPWIVIGAVIAGVSMMQLFSPPSNVSVLHLLIWSIALYLGWTLIAIPYSAWGAELSHNYNQRTKITGCRELFTLTGILVAGALPWFAEQIGWSENEGVEALGWLAILIGAPSIALLVWRVPQNNNAANNTLNDKSFNLLDHIRLFLRISENKPFLRLIAAWFINGLANGIPAVLFLLFLKFGIQANPIQTSILLLTYFLAGVISIPFWLRMSKSWGKHKTWCYAMILTCLAFIWVPILGAGDILAFWFICLVTGAGLGADLILPPSIQADVVDYDKLINKKPRTALLFSLWSMSSKLALALAVGITFPILEFAGFSATGGNDSLALTALAVIYAGFPSVLKAITVLLMFSFPITRKKQLVIQRRLLQK